MRKRLLTLIIVILVLVAVSSMAADKVVVIPLNSSGGPPTKLWGEGRVGTTTTYNASSNGITISYSNGVAPWSGAASVCPKNTWVCTAAEAQNISTVNPTSSIQGLNCSGSPTSFEPKWVQDESNTQYGKSLYAYELTPGYNFVTTVSYRKCNYLQVWCCSSAN